MSYEQVYGDWTHTDPGHYIRNDGVEVIRTSARTWTLTSWRNEDRTFRTARAAKSHADSN